MDKQQLEKRLKQLDDMEFAIEMIDHWSQADYEKINKIHDEQRKIKKQLKKMRDRHE